MGLAKYLCRHPKVYCLRLLNSKLSKAFPEQQLASYLKASEMKIILISVSWETQQKQSEDGLYYIQAIIKLGLILLSK